MSETGFGSLSYNPLPEYNDWGFGSPTPVQLGVTPYDSPSESEMEPDMRRYRTEADYLDRTINLERDTGFGSPFDNYNQPIQLTGEFALIPDDGGVTLKIQSLWVDMWDFEQGHKYTKGRGYLGPYYVKFISQATGTSYQAVGQRGRCYTNFVMDTLYAGVQPLPHGDYDIEIKWQGVNTIYISDAFTVGLRPRIPEAYNIRTHIPSHMSRGPVVISNDKMLPYTKESNLSMLLKSIGEQIQGMSGRPTTGLTSSLSWGDSSANVESTIGFPDHGAILVGGYRISYSSKTADTFEGLSYQLYFDGSFSEREEVSCDVTAIK